MLKQKFKRFKVQIRNNQKNKILQQLRNKNSKIQHLQTLISQTITITIKSQNYRQIAKHILKINQLLIQFFNTNNKSLLYFLKDKINCQQQFFSILLQEIRPFLCFSNVQVKKYILWLFDQIQHQKKYSIKQINTLKLQQPKYNEIKTVQQKLINQLLFFNGLIFKQPIILAFSFPLKSLKHFYSMDQDIKKKREQYFDISFQLIDKQLKYLTKTLNEDIDFSQQLIEATYNGQKLDLNIYLCSMNCITRIIEFFIVNNSQFGYQQNQKRRVQQHTQQSQDNIKFRLLYNVLNSHNLQNSLYLVMRNLSEKQSYTIDEDNQGSDNEIEVLISLAITGLLSNYLQLLQYLQITTISQKFTKIIPKFYSLCNKKLMSYKFHQILLLNKSNHHNKNQFNDTLTTNCKNINDPTNNKSENHIKIMSKNIYRAYFMYLFEISNIFAFKNVNFTYQQILSYCVELISFISLASLYESQSSTQSQNFDGNNDRNKLDQNPINIKSKNTKNSYFQFYFQTLLAQQHKKSSHYLQLLSILSDLIIEHDIALKDILKYIKDPQLMIFKQQLIEKSLHKQEYEWLFYQIYEFDLQKVCNFFTNTTYSIINDSTYFHKEIYLFSQNLLQIFYSFVQNLSFPKFKSSKQPYFENLWQTLYNTINECLNQLQRNIVGQNIKDKDNCNFYQQQNHQLNNCNGNLAGSCDSTILQQKIQLIQQLLEERRKQFQINNNFIIKKQTNKNKHNQSYNLNNHHQNQQQNIQI